jgi:TatD DNase family protein
MLIDSHCHLPKNREETEKIISEANEEGVVKFINIGTNSKDSVRAIEVAKQYEEVYATVGVYPHDDKEISLGKLKKQLQRLVESSDKVVGIGECGIDITNRSEGRTIDGQVALFEMQIELALKNNLPIVIHNRNGDDQVLKTLEKYRGEKLKGAAHCFDSNWEMAKDLLDFNFYISFSGLVTYPNKEALLEVVRNVPLDKFLLETDSPYLPPQQHRGKKNYPKYVKMVALSVAEEKKEPFAEICEHSFENTSNVFSI